MRGELAGDSSKASGDIDNLPVHLFEVWEEMLGG